jgi:predicted aldo/keto reductase-like oxidoreductase
MGPPRLGPTGRESTLAIFGAAAFYEVSQEHADRTMELMILSGIIHIDVAPCYDQAEQRLNPWHAIERNRFFLGCKTTERSRRGAHDELRRTVDRLQANNFDLYQFHAVGSTDELELITQPGGALEEGINARDVGRLRYIGITGHGLEVPKVFIEALNCFKFDTVLVPLNFILCANPDYGNQAQKILALFAKSDIGVMIIINIGCGPWGGKKKKNTTWYDLFIEMEWIQKSINLAITQPITGIFMARDVTLLPLVLEACEIFFPYSEEAQLVLVAQADKFEPLST